jgi:hypothetical protein
MHNLSADWRFGDEVHPSFMGGPFGLNPCSLQTTFWELFQFQALSFQNQESGCRTILQVTTLNLHLIPFSGTVVPVYRNGGAGRTKRDRNGGAGLPERWCR